MFIKSEGSRVCQCLKLLTIFALVGLSETAHAQYKSIFIPYSTVGFGIGTSNYYGDMAPYRRPLASTFKMMRWNISANYTRYFTPRLGARASFTWARIAGDDFAMNNDDKHQSNILFARNLQFRNDLKEFSLQGIFKLTPDGRSYDRRPQMGAYLFGGIALVAHNPKALYVDIDTGDKNWVKLQSLGTEGQGNAGYAKPYSLVQLAIPIGVGVRYKINSKIDVSAELGFRFTFTDYLDDVSGAYADPALFTDDPVAFALSNRTQERVSARKGKDRTPGVASFLAVNYPGTDTSDPFTALANTGFAAPGTYRGNNPSVNDAYLFGTISVHYMLPSQIKCPPLK